MQNGYNIVHDIDFKIDNRIFVHNYKVKNEIWNFGYFSDMPHDKYIVGVWKIKEKHLPLQSHN